VASGQSQSAGRVEQTVELGGRTLRMHTPPAVEVYAGLQEYWKRQQPDLVAWAADACAKAPPAQHEAIWAAAAGQGTREPTEVDLNRFINTLDGVVYLLWICLKKHHAEEFPTPQHVCPLLEAASEAKLNEVAHKTEIVTGEAEAKN